MIKNHKHHIHILFFVLVGSGIFMGSTILWEFELIEFPAPVVHYARYVNASLSDRPPETESKLNITFHKQEHSLSCEVATLKMVLDYHGFEVEELQLLAHMSWDNTERSGDVWGDPSKGFVGDIDGKMGVDGYGIHWGPIAELARKWAHAEVIEDGLASDLVAHIDAGRPVIIWSYLGRGTTMSWFTPEGEKIYAINGEHTFVVYGYKGLADNPEGFLLMDPIYGSKYWETKEFMRKWDAFGRSGVVVYN